jgi:hypothetical protein
MSKQLTGKVSFVNHEKQYVSIAYKPEGGGKEKTINGSTNKELLKKLKAQGLLKKIHNFQVGDQVQFIIQPSDKGDKMVASQINYLFNEGLDRILNRAKIQNSFNGYIKVVEGKFFIKEIESYLFFPLAISPWQTEFTEKQINEAITFTLDDIEKKEKAIAELVQVSYIPEYQKAQQLYKTKAIIEATVCMMNDFGIYVNVIGEKIQAKIPKQKTSIDLPALKLGDVIKIKITHLTPLKIAVELVAE